MNHLLLILFFISTAFSFGQSFESKLDSIVSKYDSLGAFNGIIIIAFNPESIQSFEYGYKDSSGKGKKISVNDRFDLASLAKEFTGLAILKLIDEGKLNPYDSIGKYFPELKPALQKVTVQQLANHTNGIHDFYSLTQDRDSLNNQNILKMLSQFDSTVFTPGTNWGYSNSGYVLLSILIERVTGTSFQNYCSENILEPLGMKSFCFAPTRKKVLDGYNAKKEKEKVREFHSGASGLYASGKDIVNYYETVLNDSDYWGKYFNMAKDLAENSNEKNWTYGFGWFFTEDEYGEFRAHSGRNYGFYNYMRWYEKSNTFICLLSNKDDDFIKSLREEVATLVKEELKK